jgi:hypothetical protein
MARSKPKPKPKPKPLTLPQLAAIGKIEVGTPERYRHGDVIEMRETIRAGVKAARVTTTSMVHRYLHRKEIDARQFSASQRLLEDWEAAGRRMAVTSSYGQSGGGQQTMTDKAAMANKRYIAAIRSVGQELSPILAHVVLVDESAAGWAKAAHQSPKSGITVLRLALDALARHYGLT